MKPGEDEKRRLRERNVRLALLLGAFALALMMTAIFFWAGALP